MRVCPSVHPYFCWHFGETAESDNVSLENHCVFILIHFGRILLPSLVCCKVFFCFVFHWLKKIYLEIATTFELLPIIYIAKALALNWDCMDIHFPCVASPRVRHKSSVIIFPPFSMLGDVSCFRYCSTYQICIAIDISWYQWFKNYRKQKCFFLP